MKKQVSILFENLFSFTLSSFLAQNPVEYIIHNSKYNREDKMTVCTTELKMMSFIKENGKSPTVYIHEQSVIPEAVALWYHGLDCAEALGTFSFEVEYQNKVYVMTATYEKETRWFIITGGVLDVLWHDVSLMKVAA